MSDIALPTPSEPEKATCRITISKDQAMDLKIGLPIRLEVLGEVKELSRCYNDKEKYDVVLEDPTVKNITPEEDATEEKDAATMPLDELKKIVSKL
jgi:hypothetical protein